MDYDPTRYPRFAVTADIVILTIRDNDLQVLLVERGQEPFKGELALPGGFVSENEGLDEAAARELAEETGLEIEELDDCYLEQLGSYGAPGRDPRMRVVTVAYWAICANLTRLRGGDDAKDALLLPVRDVENGRVRLAFDHEQILYDAFERLRAKLEYTAVAAKFCPRQFTIGQLRRAFETVWGTRLERGNFQRSVQKSPAFVKRADAGLVVETRRRGPPAALWELAASTNMEAGMYLTAPLASRSSARQQDPDPDEPIQRIEEDGGFPQG